jgi:dienelactone hydrolase
MIRSIQKNELFVLLQEKLMTKMAPYISWKSPITPKMLVSSVVRLSEPRWVGDDIYWLEFRPSEGGRSVIVRRTPDSVTQDMTPSDFNVGTRVHSYGGGAWTVSPKSVIFFSNNADKQIYRQGIGEEPQCITSGEGYHYADLVYDEVDGILICIREDHTVPNQEPVNTIVRISVEIGEVTVLASGADFYSSPRLHRGESGTYLAWVEWDHPNMPWDGTRLKFGEISRSGKLINVTLVAGDEHVSVLEPKWREGYLFYVSDKTGWWNLYRWHLDTPICEMEAEFAPPPWVFGYSSYDVTSNEIVCAYTQNGTWHLGRIDLVDDSLEEVKTGYTDISYVHVNGSRVLCVAGSFTEPAAIVVIDLVTGMKEVIKRSNDIALDPGYISVPQQIEFPTENGLTAHGLYYPPTNKEFEAPEGTLPPLLLKSHGGPTSAAVPSLSLYIQYYTSRGFGVLDVNYGGSTGYGKEYRDRLNGQWGILDVKDCINGAKYLADNGIVDHDRMVICGGSASGFTTLCALTFHDVFKAGASHYGISDATALVRDTHKFESRYTIKLIAPYPEGKNIYYERSPIHFTHLLRAPMIIFQGLDDKTVPPNQAEMMVDVLRKKGLPVTYVPFEGEGHGFRKAKNIKMALEKELSFFAQVLGATIADIEPVVIENFGS